jgi:hypothetical protein
VPGLRTALATVSAELLQKHFSKASYRLAQASNSVRIMVFSMLFDKVLSRQTAVPRLDFHTLALWANPDL